ncbi:MAG: LysE family translocator [Ruminococcus sp.]|nr:LysE family translocator [Ruminococcus sp.]
MMIFLKGLLIGMICGVPAGAVGALCMQRSLLYGKKSGIITGLGSSVADSFYAGVGAFGVTLVSDFLTEYQTAINLLGGFLILAMGISFILKSDKYNTEIRHKSGYIRMFMSAFGVGITNPVAVVAFMLAFSYTGIDGSQSFFYSIILIAGVFAGTFVWWIILTFFTAMIKKKYDIRIFNKVNKFSGIIMIILSVILFVKTIMER